MVRDIIHDPIFLSQDMDLKKHHQKFSGFPAQIIRHEVDHLQGILI